jgi:hypothetical protein
MRPIHLFLCLAVVKPILTLAGEPCRLRPGSDRVVTVEVDAPSGAHASGLVIVVDHPETKLGLEGEGIAVSKGAIANPPAGAIATANDLGDRVRIVIARATALPTGRLVDLHFQDCVDAAPPRAEDFTCTVTEAADPATNKVPGFTCKVGFP